MPTGKMSWKYHSPYKVPLGGFEASGTWTILYSFYDGEKNGVKYRGTRRLAYLPDTSDGKEVLFLLIK